MICEGLKAGNDNDSQFAKIDETRSSGVAKDLEATKRSVKDFCNEEQAARYFSKLGLIGIDGSPLHPDQAVWARAARK